MQLNPTSVQNSKFSSTIYNYEMTFNVMFTDLTLQSFNLSVQNYVNNQNIFKTSQIQLNNPTGFY